MRYRNEVLLSPKSIRQGLGGPLIASQGMPSTSAAWSGLGGSNRATFCPIRFSAPGIITKLWWRNGSAVSGNVDIGLFGIGTDKLPGARIVSSGSVAQSGTGVIQEVNITDYAVEFPQVLYVGLVLDNNTGAIFSGFVGTQYARAMGFVGQASAFPLPSTPAATPGGLTGSSVATDFGVAFRALVA